MPREGAAWSTLVRAQAAARVGAMALAGVKLVITGVRTTRSIAGSVARPAQEDGAEHVLTAVRPGGNHTRVTPRSSSGARPDIRFREVPMQHSPPSLSDAAVIDTIARIAEIDVNRITRTTRLTEVVTDSFRLVELAIALQEDLNVLFEPQDLDHVETVGHLVALVVRRASR
jgi:acyl carrier protein